MDEIKRLEREIQALQERLRRQTFEADEARRKLIEENRKKLEAYQAEMQRAIREHDREAQAQYERLLHEYQNSLQSEVSGELSGTDEKYRKLLEDVKRNEALLLQKNRELEQAIAEIRSDISRRGEGSGSEAADYLCKASNTCRQIQAKPHEKFMPNRLRIFQDSIADAKQLYNAGLYEAAAAVAISAGSGLERLGYAIDDKEAEWEKLFDLFSLKLKYLKSRIHQEITDWESYTGNQSKGNVGIRSANIAEINFWCRGEFDGILQTSKKYGNTLSAYSSAGREEYLRRTDSPSSDDLRKFAEETDKAAQRLNVLSALYRERYNASCQRAEWGEEIIDFLTSEINLEWMDGLTGFKEASAEALASKDFTEYIQSRYSGDNVTEDMREWLKLVFENASGNRIYIYIVPIEAHGSVVNRVILHIDYDGPEQEQYSRDIFWHICEAIQLPDESDGTVNYAADVNQLKASENKAYSETGRDLERMKSKAQGQ